MIPPEEVDVAVVGAGPAGCAAALALRARGCSVAVLEKGSFPRHKVCGDFLTPGAAALLRELGGGLVERAGPRPLRGMRITFEGRSVLSDFPRGASGWGLARRGLDAALARRAEEAGARVWYRLRVGGFRRAADGAWLVEGGHPDGARRAWRARLLVEAGGRHGLIARRLDWRRDDPSLVRYALWSHMEGVRGLGDRGEMHVLGDGYVGVAPLDDSERANVTMVLTPRAMARARGDVAGFLRTALSLHPELGPRCRDARLLAPVRGTGPLACRARRLASPGLAVVGDAAGFIDPFTGEGIFVALTSARLLAEAAGRHGLEAAATPPAYERSHRAAFAAKFRLCRLLQVVIARPWLARRVARALAARKELADRLVGATGDLLPPSDVLNPAYLGRLVLAGMGGREMAG